MTDQAPEEAPAVVVQAGLASAAAEVRPDPAEDED